MHVASFTLIHDNLGLVVSIVLFPGRLWLQLQAEADRNSNQAGWRSHVHTFQSGFWPSLSFNSDTHFPGMQTVQKLTFVDRWLWACRTRIVADPVIGGALDIPCFPGDVGVWPAFGGEVMCPWPVWLFHFVCLPQDVRDQGDQVKEF